MKRRKWFTNAKWFCYCYQCYYIPDMDLFLSRSYKFGSRKYELEEQEDRDGHGGLEAPGMTW